MKYRLIIAALISTTIPAMSGCATLSTVGAVAEVVTEVNRPADEIFNTLADEKAYYALLKFETEANQMASLAVDMGVLEPGSEKAILVADLLLRLTEVTETAQRAKSLNDAVTLADKITEGKELYHHIVGRLF